MPRTHAPARPKLAVALTLSPMTRYTVAVLADMSPHKLSGFSTGRLNPTADEIRRIAAVLQVDPADIDDDGLLS